FVLLTIASDGKGYADGVICSGGWFLRGGWLLGLVGFAGVLGLYVWVYGLVLWFTKLVCELFCIGLSALAGWTDLWIGWL
ncbi:hypothetical protein HUK83_09390, partial [Endobacter medicaginis]